MIHQRQQPAAGEEVRGVAAATDRRPTLLHRRSVTHADDAGGFEDAGLTDGEITDGLVVRADT